MTPASAPTNPRRAAHTVSISGGKDSTATYILAIRRRDQTGKDFRAVMADTGHEHPITMDFVRTLSERAGGPPIEIIKADFRAQIETRRRNLPKVWGRAGIPEDRIRQVSELLQATGNPFLDLCMLKGRFPSSQRRFCTEELKAKPLEVWSAKILSESNLVRWQGERREESMARSMLPAIQRVRWQTPPRTVVIYRPIIDLTAEQVFDLHRSHGIEPNPLYKQGMRRVGCFPCIMSGKSELATMARRFPEAVERLAEMEAIVAEVSKRGAATFFAGDTTPEGRKMAKRGEPGIADPYPSAREVFRWAQTDRGGWQLNMLDALDDNSLCVSEYGLCE